MKITLTDLVHRPDGTKKIVETTIFADPPADSPHDFHRRVTVYLHSHNLTVYENGEFFFLENPPTEDTEDTGKD